MMPGTHAPPSALIPGADFVLLDADGQRIGAAVAYRDERTETCARRWSVITV